MTKETKKELSDFILWLHLQEYGVYYHDNGKMWFNGKYYSSPEEIIKEYSETNSK